MSKYVDRLQRITDFLQRHRSVAVFVVLFGFFSIFAPSYAHASIPGTVIGTIMGILASVISAIAVMVSKLIVVVMGVLIIPILGYDAFSTSNIVSIGWQLVRDLVNMFFVVILLVYAVQLIVGKAKANWSQQIVKLFIAVVAVNFSKTICLFMIDISQIVMFTFVNALRDIAAGNFVNLFQLTSIMDITEASDLVRDGLEGAGFLGSAYLTLGLLVAVLAAMLLLALAFLYRIIILWVLIILSPIAFFLKGAEGIFSFSGGTYNEWWSKMIGATTMGPILAFFLWLALAASSGGAIAAQEQFQSTTSIDSTGIYTEIFEIERFTSLLVGLVLILVGFRAAGQSASALGGVAAKYISEDFGRKTVGGILKYPIVASGRLTGRTVTSVGRAGIAAGKRAGVEVGRQAERRLNVAGGIGRELVDGGRILRNSDSRISRALGGAVLSAGGRLQNLSSASTSAAREQAQARVAGMSMGQRLAELDALTEQRTNNTLRVGKRDDFEQILLQFSTNRDMQRRYRQQLEGRFNDPNEVNRRYNERMQEALQFVGGDARARLIGDDAGLASGLLRTQAANAHLLGQDEVRRVVQNGDFRIGMLSTDSAGNENVQQALSEIVQRQRMDRDGNMHDETLLDDLLSGRGGIRPEVRAAANNMPAERRLQFANENDLRERFNEGSIPLNAVNLGVIQMDDPENPGTEIPRPNTDNILRALATSNRDLSTLDTGVRFRMQQRINEWLQNAPADGGIEDANLRNRLAVARASLQQNDNDTRGELGVRADGTLRDDLLANEPTARQRIGEAARSRPELLNSLIDPVQQVQDTVDQLVNSPESRRAIAEAGRNAAADALSNNGAAQQAALAAQDEADAAARQVANNGGNMLQQRAARQSVIQAAQRAVIDRLQAEAEQAAEQQILESAIQGNGELTSAIVSSISRETINQLVQDIQTTQDQNVRNQLTQTIEMIGSAIETEMQRNVENSAVDENELRNLERTTRRALNLVR